MVDSYSSYVVLLIPFDSTNQFKDESLFNHFVEFDGTPAIQDIGSKWENGCLALDANGQIKIADANSLSLESNNFTFESWVKFSALPLVGEYFDFFSKYDYAAEIPEYRFSLHNDSGILKLKFSYTNDGINIIHDFTDPWTPTIDVWYHVAISRSGSNFYFFVNGVRYGSVKTGSELIFNSTQRMNIGNSSFKGYIQDFRFTRGISRYSSDFSLQDEPFVAKTDLGDPWYESVSLLLPMDSETLFIDHSNSISAVTKFGDVKISQTQSKWGNGSGYFDGSGNYLIPSLESTNNIFEDLSSAWTIEYWLFVTGRYNVNLYPVVFSCEVTYGTRYTFICKGEGSSVSFLAAFYLNGVSQFLDLGAYNINTWYHVAFVCEGNRLIKGYVNGQYKSSLNVTSYIPSSSIVSYRIGNGINFNDPFQGHLQDLRITKGVARYTSDFFPPAKHFFPQIESNDPYFSSVKLLLPMENDSAFVDYSASPRNITKFGDMNISLAQSKRGNGSCYFDGIENYLYTTNAGFAFGTGDFTIEAWVFPTSTSGNRSIISTRDSVEGCYFGFSNGNLYPVAFNSTTQLIVSTIPATINYWNHILLSRSVGTLRIFVNGIQGASASNSTNFLSSVCRIGSTDSSNTSLFSGYIQDVRITKGIARHTSNFIPPKRLFVPKIETTRADPYFENVSLLLPMDDNSAFTDYSAIPKGIVPQGNVKISAAQSKWGNGSGYFSGSDEYLSVSASNDFDLLGGDLTVEVFVKNENPDTSNGGVILCVGDASGYWQIIMRQDRLKINSYNGRYSDYIADQLLDTNWHHIAWTKSGNTHRLFYDGDLMSTSGTPPSGSPASLRCYVGGNYNGSTTCLTGYLQDLRVTKGISRYESNFIPPGKIPVNYIRPDITLEDPYHKNVSLLLPMSGSNNSTSFVDYSALPKAISVYGNAKIHTSQSKWGNGSGYFDGVGDYLSIPYSSEFDLSIPTYTIEAWFRPNTLPFVLFSKDTQGSNFDFCIQVNSTTLSCTTNTTNNFTVTVPTITTNAWHHIAYVRNNGILTAYLDGISCGSTTMNITNESQNNMTIGCASWNNPGQFLNGFIQDFRITRGIARYISNFTLQNRSLVQTRTMITNGQHNEIHGNAGLNQIDSMKKIWIMNPNGFLIEKLTPDLSGNFITKCAGKVVWCGFPFDPERWVGLHATSTAYSVGDIVIEYPDESAVVLECIVAGTTDSEKSALSRTRGAEIFDGTVIWKSLGILSNNIPRFNFAIA